MDEAQLNQSRSTKAGEARWGPKDPIYPTTQLEVVARHPSGVRVVRQGYEDGFLYEYRVPIAAVIDLEVSHYIHPPLGGRIIRSWNESRYNYYSVWMSREAIERAVPATVSTPDCYATLPIGEPELLEEGDCPPETN